MLLAANIPGLNRGAEDFCRDIGTIFFAGSTLSFENKTFLMEILLTLEPKEA
jgi:hypothetical protein